ncbi:Maf family protein [Agaribacter flavus]|uniref:7-methyl-GTP pyrophosphatase n=1 Tax=Agaribacter flavus TaxID=1902781 RepID=A0ABV7FMP0_9ALTE
MNNKILLASSSPYRKTLLSQLGLAFDSHSPNIDESPKEHESAEQLAKRLSFEKAQACQDKYPDHFIIASDQVCCLQESDKQILLSKPGNAERAYQQLRLCNNKRVDFYTGLCLLPPVNLTTSIDKQLHQQKSVSRFSVKFRALDDSEILNYVQLEKPFDCAGSFKVEGLGMHLFESLEGEDQNSLIGLPLLNLCKMLRAVNISPLVAKP